MTNALRRMLARGLPTPTGELPRVVGVTSAISGEGVTFLCRSLGAVLANDFGESVCMVDLNWARPALWPGEAVGAAGYLLGDADLDRAVVPTGNPGLTVLPAGSATVSQRPVLARSDQLGGMLRSLAASHRFVVVDLPALTASPEAAGLAARCDAVVLVVRQGVTPAARVTAALDDLHHASVLGVVLNGSSSRIPKWLLRRLAPGGLA